MFIWCCYTYPVHDSDGRETNFRTVMSLKVLVENGKWIALKRYENCTAEWILNLPAVAHELRGGCEKN